MTLRKDLTDCGGNSSDKITGAARDYFSDLKRSRKYPCRPVILCTDDLSQDAEKICVQIHGLELGEQDRSVV